MNQLIEEKNISTDRATADKVYNELCRAVVTLLNSNPFYGHILSNIKKVVDPHFKAHDGGRGTMGVGWDGHQVELRVQPDSWLEEMSPFAQGILQHELLHIIFKHLWRIKDKKLNFAIANIAADMAINQLIGYDKLPNWVCNHTKNGFEDNLTMDEYYDLLVKNAIEISMSGIGQDGKDGKCVDSHSGWGKGKNGQEEDFDGIDSPQAKSALRDLVKRAYDKVGEGNLPGTITGAIEAFIKPKKHQLHWSQILRRFFTSVMASEIEYTKKRRSRRYNTVPGLKFSAEGAHILFGLDVSGSVSDDQLAQFFGELRAIARMENVIIDFIQHDTEIKKVDLGYKNFQVGDKVAGRGGTDLTVIYDYLNEALAAGKEYSCVIHCTDGWGPYPERPPRVPTLFVYTRDHSKVKWGSSFILDC